MFLCLSVDELCNVTACLLAHGREAGPVVDIDNRDAAFLADDGIAAVHVEFQHFGRCRCKLAELLFVELGVIDTVQIVPVEEICFPGSVEFHRIAVEMFLKDCFLDIALMEFLQEIQLFIVGVGECDVLFVNGMDVAALDPDVQFLRLIWVGPLATTAFSFGFMPQNSS